MRDSRRLVLALVPVLLLCAAGRPRAQGPMGGPLGRTYDPATVETVRGQVTAVRTTAGRGRGGGMHLELETPTGRLDVRLGPAWFLEREKLAAQVGDRLEVTGSRVTIAGKPALIAAQVKKGDRTVTLREASGLPLWRGPGGPPP